MKLISLLHNECHKVCFPPTKVKLMRERSTVFVTPSTSMKNALAIAGEQPGLCVMLVLGVGKSINKIPNNLS